MRIATGLFDHMVLQRTANNVSRAAVTGTTDASGTVRATVTLKGRTVDGFSNKTVGKAGRGKFAASVDGLAAGGPYTITLRVGEETVTVSDVLVGDVWIAAGQSNMQGVGLLADAARPHPMCRAFYMDDHWEVARDPINNTRIAVDEVHAIRNAGKAAAPKTVTGTGPAVAFIQEMHRITKAPQGIIASSHGGTSMAEWSPERKSLGSKSFYGATLRRYQKNGAFIAGMIWYQGESEAMSPEATEVYPRKMKELVRAFRRDLRAATLPIATVQIARFVGQVQTPHWNRVQEMQRQFPAGIANLATVPAIDLSLDDGIHIGGKAQQRLGVRLAHAMLNLLRHPKAPTPPPIGLKSIAMEVEPGREFATIVVTYDNVVGELRAGGRPSGFVLLDDRNINLIFDIRLEGNRALLRTDRIPADMAGRKLHYGYGFDPLCNITDAADRSLPVFGPIVLPAGKKRL